MENEPDWKNYINLKNNYYCQLWSEEEDVYLQAAKAVDKCKDAVLALSKIDVEILSQHDLNCAIKLLDNMAILDIRLHANSFQQ